MSSINSFRQAANANPDATLKYEKTSSGGNIARRQDGAKAAPKDFFGKTVVFLRENTPLGPANSGTMSHFKAALGKEHGEGPAKMLEKAGSEARKELAALNKDYNEHGWPEAHMQGREGNLGNDKVKEMRVRLGAVVDAVDLGRTTKLTSKTVENADRLAGILAAHKNDPMLKLMGPTKFLGYLLAVEKRIADGSPAVQAAGARMSPPEKAALYGYTCADYKVLNPALWNPTPNVKSGVEAYCDHVAAALSKAPVFTATNASGQVVSARAFNNPEGQPAWAANRYKQDTVVVESGFYSTAQGSATGSNFTAKVISNGGARDVSGFSAWHVEAEVLYAPGTRFQSTVDRSGTKFTFTEVHLISPDAAKVSLSKLAGKPMDPQVVSDLAGRVVFDSDGSVAPNQPRLELTQFEVDRLAGAILLTPDALHTALSKLVGQAIDPEVAGDLAGRVKFDHVGRIIAEQPGLQLTHLHLDRLLASVVKSPTLANSGGERMLRSEREITLDFMGMLEKARPDASQTGKMIIDDAAKSMKQLWLGGNLNSASAKAALLIAAQGSLAAVAPDLAAAAAKLGTEIDRLAAQDRGTQLALYHDNTVGRRFESELVQALVKTPPPSVVAAAGQIGAFVRDNVLSTYALAPGTETSEPSPQFSGKALDPKMVSDGFQNLILVLVDDSRPWHAETPEIGAFVNAVKTGQPLQAQVDAFANMMTKTETGFDVMKQSFLAVKISTNLRKSTDTARDQTFKSIAPWVEASTENYKEVVVPARGITPSVGGIENVKRLDKDAKAAQTSSFGTVLPYQPAMQPDVGTPANWGSGRNLPATAHNNVRETPDETGKIMTVKPFESQALLNNQNNVNGASGSTTIMTYLFQHAQAAGVKLSIDDAFAGTMMFLTFDGGHSLPESTGVFNSIVSTPLPTSSDEATKSAVYEARATTLATHVTSYDQLHGYFASPDTRDAVNAAVDTAFRRAQSFFAEVHSERLNAS